MSLKDVYEKWTSISLIVRILAGLIIGTCLALVLPGLGGISTLGSLFVGALKAIAPFLVFFLVISSLITSSTGLGGKFKTVIILYILTTVVAATVACALMYIYPVHVTLTGIEGGSSGATTDIWALINTLLMNTIANPVSSLMSANYLGILFWAIIIGLVGKALAKPATLELATDVSNIITAIVRGIIQFAPFGILGLIYDAVSTNGVEIFVEYGELILLLVVAMLIVMLVTNPIIAGVCMRRNPYPLIFRCLRESGITAFFTRSSAANIPVNIGLCEKLGLDKELYSVSIPLGATINMNGAAVTITVMTMVAAFTIGMNISITAALPLCILATVAACGASGVSGGSLLLIPMACSFLGISDDIAMQMVAIGFIIGVIQDSLETMINSSSDVVFTTVAEVVDSRNNGIDFEPNLKN